MSTTPRADRLDFDESSNFDVPWSDEYRALETELTATQSQLKEALEKGERWRAMAETQKAYSEYLAEAERQTMGFLAAHNWKYSPEFLAKGETLRAALSECAALAEKEGA